MVRTHLRDCEVCGKPIYAFQDSLGCYSQAECCKPPLKDKIIPLRLGRHCEVLFECEKCGIRYTEEALIDAKIFIPRKRPSILELETFIYRKLGSNLSEYTTEEEFVNLKNRSEVPLEWSDRFGICIQCGCVFSGFGDQISRP
jgi:hypothetical protein